jgi:hypothetical protein
LQHDRAQGAADHDHEGRELEQGAHMAALQELAHQNGDQAEGDADQADDVHAADRE